MRGTPSDRASELLLSAVVEKLSADPSALGEKALRVWRVRSPTLVMQSKKRGESPIGTATEFMGMLLGSLRSDSELNWTHCEQRSREYGRLRARQTVPVESLVDELAVYRRTAMELISSGLPEGLYRDRIVAVAQSRLEDVADHLNQSIAASYVDCIEHRRPRRSRLAATGTAARRRSIDLAEAARNGLGKTVAVLGLGARASWFKAKMAPLTDATRRIARSTHVKDAKRRAVLT